MKQQINVYITEINTYKQQISTLSLTNQQEAARYLQQIEMLKGEIERLKGAQDNNARYLQQIEMLKSEIERLKNLPTPKIDDR